VLNLFYILVSLVLLAGFLLANMKYANPVAAADVRAAAEIAARLHVAQAGMRAYIADVFEAKGELTFGADADVRAALVPEYITLPPAKSGVTWHVGVSALDSRNIFICATGVSGTLGELGLRQLAREFSADDLVFGASACEEYGTDVSTADALTLYVRGAHVKAYQTVRDWTGEVALAPSFPLRAGETSLPTPSDLPACLDVALGERCNVLGKDGVPYEVEFVGEAFNGTLLFAALEDEVADSETFMIGTEEVDGWYPHDFTKYKSDGSLNAYAISDIEREFATRAYAAFPNTLQLRPPPVGPSLDVRSSARSRWPAARGYDVFRLYRHLFGFANLPSEMRVCANKPGGIWYLPTGLELENSSLPNTFDVYEVGPVGESESGMPNLKYGAVHHGVATTLPLLPNHHQSISANVQRQYRTTYYAFAGVADRSDRPRTLSQPFNGWDSTVYARVRCFAHIPYH
jgi:hypothetical protein